MTIHKVLFGTLLTLLTLACEGPQGSPGTEAQVVEVEGVNFNFNGLENTFNTRLTYRNITDFEFIASDAVLVYRFEGTEFLNDGSPIDVWSPLPQNIFFDEGDILQYVFTHTSIDLDLFIEGNFDLSTLSRDFTDNQIFRIVFVPGILTDIVRIDSSNLNNVMSTLGIEEQHVKRLEKN